MVVRLLAPEIQSAGFRLQCCFAREQNQPMDAQIFMLPPKSHHIQLSLRSVISISRCVFRSGDLYFTFPSRVDHVVVVSGESEYSTWRHSTRGSTFGVGRRARCSFWTIPVWSAEGLSIPRCPVAVGLAFWRKLHISVILDQLGGDIGLADSVLRC